MELVGVVDEDDSSVFAVGGDVAVAELVERGLFPTVLLAAVHREFDDPGAEGAEGGSECAASADFGELMMITDKDHFGSDACGLVDDRGDVTDPGHPCLVQHDQG